MSIIAMKAEQSTGGAPSIKLRAIGSKAILAVVGVDEIDDSNDDGTPKMTSRGDRAKIIIVKGLVVAGDGVVKGDDSNDRPIEVGELASFWFGGSRWFQMLQAKKAATADMMIGDLMQVSFDRTEPPSNPAHSPKQVWDIRWRSVKPEEADWSAKAIAAYQAEHAVTAMKAETPETHVPSTQQSAVLDAF